MERQLFIRKAHAVKALKVGQILCNRDITQYFILDNYTELAQLITEAPTKQHYYEFIPGNAPVRLFLDIEMYGEKDKKHFDNHAQVVEDIISKTKNILEKKCDVQLVKTIVLEAHNDTKKSYHVIGHCERNGRPVYFENVKLLKRIVNQLKSFSVVDMSVYREGLFRTYQSTKSNENRPLIKSKLSDEFTDILDTFVCYRIPGEVELIKATRRNSSGSSSTLDSDNSKTLVDDNTTSGELEMELKNTDIACIKKFVKQKYNITSRDIREVVLDQANKCIVAALNRTFCHNIDREHKSNHQYIIIDAHSSKQKCHDTDCKDFKHNEIGAGQYPKEVREVVARILNENPDTLINSTIEECKEYITENFDDNVQEILFDRQDQVFRGNASENALVPFKMGQCNGNCKFEHHINNNGYCLRCSVCNAIFPKKHMIRVDDRYKNLSNFWVKYTQLVNNGTVNINYSINYYNGEEEFSCDINLDPSIFNDKDYTYLYNHILDGHKVTMIGELFSKLYPSCVFVNDSWYFFNGVRWAQDTKEMKKKVIAMEKHFRKIKTFYESMHTSDKYISIIKNVKSLINKLYKPSFQDEVLKGAQLYLDDPSFIEKLNHKKHIIPFTNGVYDLNKKEFRTTLPEDYVDPYVGYNYDDSVNNPEVHTFINQVLPDKKIRDYVLKKFSECLNGDIPNTHFLMFTGDGANGKSQLLNLMKHTMGDFGEKAEVTLLTRKRNNANEANPEKAKFINKRFAFLSEPEDGEKINIGLLKELTGSEEIVARELYKSSVSFVMETKLFLACNELPDIKGEDSALWRRIRVVDFPSRFLDQPKESNEYKIDRTLPSRMRTEVSWRQTFMNILIDYYYKDIQEPNEVMSRTFEYRDDNNELMSWVTENIKMEKGSMLALKDVCAAVYENKTRVGVKEKSKLKKQMEKCIKLKFPQIVHTCVKTTIDKQSFQGWFDVCFSNEEKIIDS